MSQLCPAASQPPAHKQLSFALPCPCTLQRRLALPAYVKGKLYRFTAKARNQAGLGPASPAKDYTTPAAGV